jgi:hypothetical protein
LQGTKNKKLKNLHRYQLPRIHGIVKDQIHHDEHDYFPKSIHHRALYKADAPYSFYFGQLKS